MAPGYYDAIIAACRTAGFEPHVDQHGAGSTVWGYIAEGRGVGLVVSSLIEQLAASSSLTWRHPARYRPSTPSGDRTRISHAQAFLREREPTREERHWV